MRKNLICGAIVLVCLLAAQPGSAGVDAAAAFEQLKELEGTWTGTPEGKGEEAEAEAAAIDEVTHVFEISAGGTVVMETMAPGTDHEMINMYHLDGDDLLVTHYCAGGNQPRMRLDRESSSAGSLVFDFDGGTNLDPSTDHYIHSANLKVGENGVLDSTWYAYAGEEQVAEMVFHLKRSSKE